MWMTPTWSSKPALDLLDAYLSRVRARVEALSSEHLARMECLDQLFERSLANRWWACKTAVQALEKAAIHGIQQNAFDPQYVRALG